MTKQEILNPHDHDVLSGRGNFVNYHAGNEHFRALVRKHKVAYVACPKPQKGKFSKLIYEEIRSRNPPGRFLKQDLKTKLWYDIGEKKALDKTRQALREGAPEIQKELGGEDDDYDDDGVEFDGSPLAQSPLQQQQGFLFQNEPNFVDRTPTYGMRNFVNHMHRVPLLSENFQTAAPETFSNNLSGVHPPSPHIVRQNIMQQSNAVARNGMEASSNIADLDAPTVSSANPASLSILSQSSVRNPGMATQEQLQQLRQQQHQQQQQLQMQIQQLHLLQQSQNLRESHDNLVVPMRTQSMVPSPSGQEDNPLRNLRSYSESGNNHSKFSSLQHNSSIFALPSQYEPRPIDPYHFNQQTNDISETPVSPSYYETEQVAPLPSRRNLRDRRNTLEREGSCSSLVVDNIFSSDVKDIKPSETGANMIQVPNKSTKFNMSSQHLSALSLSMDDMGHDDDYNQLGTLLNNSMRLSIRAPQKYNIKNTDGASLTDHGSGTSNTGTLLAGLDMSVATLGDRFSDFDGSVARMMTDSSTDMSFGNVFDDTDKDHYTSGSKNR